jgi:hypothetical protein
LNKIESNLKTNDQINISKVDRSETIDYEDDCNDSEDVSKLEIMMIKI